MSKNNKNILSLEYFNKIIIPFIEQFKNHEKTEEEIFHELRLSIEKINTRLHRLDMDLTHTKIKILFILFLTLLSIILSIWSMYNIL